MNIDTAFEIINQYGALLEKTARSDMVFAAPEDLLPYPKETIKEAIKLRLVTSLLSSKDGANIAALKFAYSQLAHFIPRELADLSIRGVQALTSADKNHPDWQYVNTTLQMQEQILAGAKSLLEEMEKYLQEWKQRLGKTGGVPNSTA